MDPIRQFEQEKKERIKAYEDDYEFRTLSHSWLKTSMIRNYVYNFTWMGRPIIQNPIDMVVMQELIWQVKPDLIIETGIAHGGSLIFYASILELMGNGEVLGIDIDIRQHNRQAIEKHTMMKRISMIEGSSINPEIVEQVYDFSKDKQNILVSLDSNHTHDHVLAELKAYAPLVSRGSYCVVFDTFVEDMPTGFFSDRPWDKGNNPKTAVNEYLNLLKKDKHNGVDKTSLHFEIDKTVENKLLITSAPDGFLKRL